MLKRKKMGRTLSKDDSLKLNIIPEPNKDLSLEPL